MLKIQMKDEFNGVLIRQFPDGASAVCWAIKLASKKPARGFVWTATDLSKSPDEQIVEIGIKPTKE